MSNKKLEQQAEFLRNITRLLEFAHANKFELVLDLAHLDTGCEFGRSVHSDGLALSFKLFGLAPDGHWDYFGLKEDHAMLGKFWKSLDTRCVWEGRTYSMPWTAVDN